MEFLSPAWWSALMAIILIDLVLAGDNAIVIGLAAADEQGGVRRLALAGDTGHRLHAGGLGQQAQLFQTCVEMRQPQVDAHQDGKGTGIVRRGGQAQSSTDPGKRSVPPAGAAGSSGGRRTSGQAYLSGDSD